MFRRRPFRPGRPINRRIQGRRPHTIPPKLIEAHQCFDQQEYNQAAELFLDLAENALKRGFPQAPALFLRAGESFILNDQGEEGGKLLLRGLNILLIRQQWPRLHRSLAIIRDRLKVFGHEGVLTRIDEWVKANIPEKITASDAWRNYGDRAGKWIGKAAVKLPSNCLNCGGPVNPGEIDWFDSDTAFCTYCGCVLPNNDV